MPRSISMTLSSLFPVSSVRRGGEGERGQGDKGTYHKVIPQIRHRNSPNRRNRDLAIERRTDLPVFLGRDDKVDRLVALQPSAPTSDTTSVHRNQLTTMINLGDNLLDRPNLVTNNSPRLEKSTLSFPSLSAHASPSLLEGSNVLDVPEIPAAFLNNPPAGLFPPTSK